MQLFTRLREKQVQRIETQVMRINNRLAQLEGVSVYDVDADTECAALIERRRKLWLRRSEIVSKLPPVYQEET